MFSWNRFADSAREDPQVLGLILSGSRGRGVGREDSDWDCYVITAGQAMGLDASDEDGTLDAVELTLEEFRSYALPGTSEFWNAYAFAHVHVEVDKLDGEIAALAAAKEFLSPEDATHLARERLDAYVNAAVRAVKSAIAGETGAAALDTTESVAPALDALFAFDSRVRPFNRYLRTELERHPLGAVVEARSIVDALVAAASGDAAATRESYGLMASSARTAGFGDVLDEWGDHLLLLRGRST